MTDLWDDQGNLVKDVVSADEAKKLQDQLEEQKRTLEQKEAELAKYRDKNNNLHNLAKKTAAEKQEMFSKASDREKYLLEKIETLESRDSQLITVRKDKIKKMVVGSDAGLLEEVEQVAQKLGVDDAISDEEMQNIYTQAMGAVERAKSPNINPLNAFVPAMDQGAYYPDSRGRGKNYADTDDGKETAKSIGIEIEPLPAPPKIPPVNM